MQRRRHTPEQIVRKLREADRLLGEGIELPEVIKHLEVSEQTYHRWRNQFGGMKADDVKRLKELEAENARLSGSCTPRSARARACRTRPDREPAVVRADARSSPHHPSRACRNARQGDQGRSRRLSGAAKSERPMDSRAAR
jgi:hypothetical protein